MNYVTQVSCQPASPRLLSGHPGAPVPASPRANPLGPLFAWLQNGETREAQNQPTLRGAQFYLGPQTKKEPQKSRSYASNGSQHAKKGKRDKNKRKHFYALFAPSMSPLVHASSTSCPTCCFFLTKWGTPKKACGSSFGCLLNHSIYRSLTPLFGP